MKFRLPAPVLAQIEVGEERHVPEGGSVVMQAFGGYEPYQWHRAWQEHGDWLTEKLCDQDAWGCGGTAYPGVRGSQTPTLQITGANPTQHSGIFYCEYQDWDGSIERSWGYEVRVYPTSLIQDGNFEFPFWDWGWGLPPGPNADQAAGAWMFHADAPEALWSDFSIADPPPPNGSLGSLRVNIPRSDVDGFEGPNWVGHSIHLQNQFATPVPTWSSWTQSPEFLIAEFDILVEPGRGGGSVYLGSGGIHYDFRGPEIDWFPDGRIVAVTDDPANADSSSPPLTSTLLPDYPRGEWQRVRVEVDFINNPPRYAVFWGVRDAPLIRLADGIRFRAEQRPSTLDRVVIARFAVHPGNTPPDFTSDVDSYLDNFSVHAYWLPNLVLQPADQAVPANVSYSLKVLVNGSDLEYQWYQGTSGNTDVPVPGATLPTLTAPAPPQTSTFWVRAKNAKGTIDSQTARVTVLPSAVVTITEHPASQSVPSGNRVRLRVVASGATPLTYQWYQGATGDASTPVGYGDSLFESPPVTGVARYWVQVTDKWGVTADSETATLTPVVQPPTIITHPQSQTAPRARPFPPLTVTATGSSPLTYQWYEGRSGDTTHPVTGAVGSRLEAAPLLRTTSFWVRVRNAAGFVDSNDAFVRIVHAVDEMWIGSWPAFGTPSCEMMAVHDGVAFTGSDEGVELYEVSDPFNLRRISEYRSEGRVSGLVVSGHYAYVSVTGAGLLVLDISDAANPTSVGSHGTAGSATGIALSGDYACVSDGDAGLQVFDVRDRTIPRLAGSYDTDGFASGVAVSGHCAYVSDGWAGMHVIDLTDPTSPKRIAGVGGFVKSAAVSGSLACVIADDYDLQIVDIGSPSDPRLLGRWWSADGDKIHDVFISDGFAYVSTDLDWLNVLDINSPADPRLVGRYYPNINWSGPDSIVVSDNRAYLAPWSLGIFVVDVSVPTAPAAIQGEATGVCILDDHGYLACGVSGVQVLDVRDPALPKRVGGCATSGRAFDVRVAGKSLYVVEGEAGVEVFDLGEPVLPKRVGGYATGGRAINAWVAGKYLYISEGEAGLEVVDVSDPASPRRSGGYDTSGNAGDVCVSDQYAYISEGIAGFEIVDISDPAAPRRVGGYDTSGSTHAVRVAGPYAYVADGSSLQVFEVSDPSRPRLVGMYLGGASEVFVAGRYAHVGNWSGGVDVIDVSDPSRPGRVGGYDPLGWTYGMFGSGDHVFVSGGAFGLAVLKATAENSAPAGAGDTLERQSGRPSKIAATELAANDTDADGDSLTVVSVSALSPNGATVTLADGWVFYDPPAEFNAEDTFTYTVDDGYGGQAVGEVRVTVQAEPPGPSGNLLPPVVQPDGVVRLGFAGIPGRPYRVQRATQLGTPDWTVIGSVLIGNDGFGEFEDPSPLSGDIFYRTVYP